MELRTEREPLPCETARDPLPGEKEREPLPCAAFATRATGAGVLGSGGAGGR